MNKNKTYRDLDYHDAEDFASALSLNTDGEENHRLAKQLLFKVMQFAEPKGKELQKKFKASNSSKDENSNFYAWVYENNASKFREPSLQEDLLKEGLQIHKNALADIEGMMPEIDPSGERTHPGWTTIKELKKIIRKIKTELGEK